MRWAEEILLFPQIVEETLHLNLQTSRRTAQIWLLVLNRIWPGVYSDGETIDCECIPHEVLSKSVLGMPLWAQQQFALTNIPMRLRLHREIDSDFIDKWADRPLGLHFSQATAELKLCGSSKVLCSNDLRAKIYLHWNKWSRLRSSQVWGNNYTVSNDNSMNYSYKKRC